ncbi:hypothetical protein DEJ28_03170 [Curtobacterium sp. MCPF17_002]|uniref:hypothetical protein n=1 Tax=Curtobacterium sp. MCPF17_002 TaxID=2175645 RepID=UPI000DA89FB1|nr:hypothetical protein [Curtobacterium sp. MCPF17_002]WIB78117.1 hypothetical protein DEJ28_03170 [Curtobacterium sp. MCPF17_002]
MFKLGWQVFRQRVGDVVDPARARRAVWIAGTVAVLALALLVVLQVVFAWAGTAPVRASITVGLATLAAGMIAFACCPMGRPPAPSNTINGRQVRADWQLAVRWSVQPYLGRTARPVAPDDRAAVLNDVPLLQLGLIHRLSRTGPLLVGLALLGLTALSFEGDRSYVLLWTLLYVFTLPDLVRRLGRAERARLAALAASSPSPETQPAQRRRDPSGSKVRLPDE